MPSYALASKVDAGEVFASKHTVLYATTAVVRHDNRRDAFPVVRFDVKGWLRVDVAALVQWEINELSALRSGIGCRIWRPISSSPFIQHAIGDGFQRKDSNQDFSSFMAVTLAQMVTHLNNLP